MTRYDRVAGHPLAGVPQHVFDVVHAEVAGSPGVDPNEREALVYDVVYALRTRDLLTWPGRLPDREALVLAVMSAQAWQANEDGRTVSEYLVDTVVLPLLAGYVGPSRTPRPDS